MQDNTQPIEQSLNFEAALAELEAIVKNMEKGDLSLEKALESFELGVKLSRNCQTSLKNAEQQVQQLTEKNGMLEAEPFSPIEEC